MKISLSVICKFTFYPARRRHLLYNIIYSSVKTKSLSPHILLGQDQNHLWCHPACRAVITRPLCAYSHTPIFCHGGSYSVLHTPEHRSVSARPRKSIRSDLISPQFHRLRLSVETVLRLTYSFSSVWLYYITLSSECQ